MTNIREEYLWRYGGYEDLAAIGLARDLMKGDPLALRAGYTARNAAIAACDVFPEQTLNFERIIEWAEFEQKKVRTYVEPV